MKKIFILSLFFINCSNDKKAQNFQIQNFTIRNDTICTLKVKKGVDSKVGIIHCDNFQIAYDYERKLGFATELDSKNDFLMQKYWANEFYESLNLQPQNEKLDSLNDLIKIDSIDHFHQCVYFTARNKKFKHKYNVPDELKNITSKNDTLNHLIVKRIYDLDNPRKITLKFKEYPMHNITNDFEQLTLYITSNYQISNEFIENLILNVSYNKVKN